METDPSVVVRSLLEAFGKIRFFNKYLSMAVGHARGAAVLDLSVSRADELLEKMRLTRSAEDIVSETKFVELEEAETPRSERSLLRAAIDEAEDGVVLEKAVLESRPEAREYVIVCRVSDESGERRASCVGGAVVRDVC